MSSNHQMWFKAKKYGYGWYPNTWQGWLILAIFMALIVGWICLVYTWFPAGDWQFAALCVFGDILLTSLLIIICVKTGEPAKWRWGK